MQHIWRIGKLDINFDLHTLRVPGNSYRDGRRLSGVIFLHRITDVRVGGVSYRMIKMLQELCGEKALANVVICTTMWESEDPNVLAQRETEMQNTFWKPLLNKGAKLDRHDNGHESALRAVTHILSRGGTVDLEIQRQIVEENKKISETMAARQAQEEIEAQIEAARIAHEAQMERQRQAQAEAIRLRERRYQEEMEAMRRAQRQYEAEQRKQERERRLQEEKWQRQREQQEAERYHLEEMERHARWERERQHQEQMELQRRQNENNGDCVIF